ncbi:Ankyrin repeat protein [Dirofilaria immitis]|nr:Ankyrin repeat protein [Dirofilaria immitis]
MYGDASSHAYPLAKLDTINQETGELNEDSALSLIVYGETTKHLQLLDGLLGDLLEVKWESFGRIRLAISFGCYLFFYICIFTAFMCRPFSLTTTAITANYLKKIAIINNAFSLFNGSLFVEGSPIEHSQMQLSVSNTGNSCYYWQYFGRGWQQNVRLAAELAVLLMTIFQIVDDAMDIHSTGRKRWWRLLNVEYRNITAPNIINILDHPMEAVMRVFIMTIGEFMIFIAGWLFYVAKQRWHILASVMQLNLLIAMMGRTYDLISGTQTEWKRQWAQVILMLEFSLRPKARLNALLKYSRPIGTNKRERAFVVVRKTTCDSLSKTEKQLRELQEQSIREKKRALLKGD